MGWTYTRRNKGESAKEFFSKEFNGELLDIGGNPFRGPLYAAVRTDDGRVFAIVILINWNPSDYWYNFGFKTISEDMGPVDYAGCPKRILDQLSPLEDWLTPGTDTYRWAKRWRERASYWTNLNRPNLKVGDVITFSHPLDYGRWGKFDTMRVVKTSLGNTHFTPVDSYGTFRILNDTYKTITQIERDGKVFWTRPPLPEVE